MLKDIVVSNKWDLATHDGLCRILKIGSARLVTVLGIILFSVPCAGQVSPKNENENENELFRDSLRRHISYRHSAESAFYLAYPQGSGKIRAELAENAAELQRLDNFIRYAVVQSDFRIKNIRVTGYCSIEGGYARNQELSRERAEQFYSYLCKTYSIFHYYPHDIAWVIEDWTGLSKLVRGSNINEREEILEIIRKVSGFDEREALIKRLNGGQTYKEIEAMFPKLRRVEVQIEYEQLTLEEGTPAPVLHDNPERSTGNATKDSRYTRQPLQWVPLFGQHRSLSTNYRFVFKTNLLLWAGVQYNMKHTTTVANAALEYYITPHWSVEIGAMYSYWRYNANKAFQGLSGYRIEPRYRFPISGNSIEVYVGTYFRSGDYDLRKAQTVDKGQLTVDSYHAGGNAIQATRSQHNTAQPTVNYQLSTVNYTGDYTGDYWDAGLSTGLTIRLIDSLGLEVGMRAGYIKTGVFHYTREGDYNWFEGKGSYNRVRITDLNFSLIYRLR